MEQRPHFVILAGPNGAGKSTAAPGLLQGAFAVDEFVNADSIARGLSAFKPEEAAIEAGRMMLRRLDDLAEAGKSFATETTLASRSFVPRVCELRKRGYKSHLFFLWLPSADVAVARVAQRVQTGGHDVPAETIRQRYDRGLANLFKLYMPVVDSWQLHDASDLVGPKLIAAQALGEKRIIALPELWQPISEPYAT